MSKEKKTVEIKVEDLEKVSGGTIFNLRDDFIEFRNLGLFSDPSQYSPTNVRNMFDRFKIRYEDYGGTKNNNRYYFEDREITREEAFQIVRNAIL